MISNFFSDVISIVDHLLSFPVVRVVSFLVFCSFYLAFLLLFLR